MDFIRKLLGLKDKREIQKQQTMQQILESTPECGKTILIISPKYGESKFSCEISISSKDLFVWAKHHAENVSSSNVLDQAAREALPIWLDNSNSSNESMSYIPASMYHVIRPYIQNIMQEFDVSLFCFECRDFVENIIKKELNVVERGNGREWVDHWECCEGHTLYHEDHEITYSFSRR